MIRNFSIDLDSVDFKYYPFVVSLEECSEICNFVNDLSTRTSVPSKTKDVNVKVFNMITTRNEAKTMVKHIPYNWKWKFNSTTRNFNQKWNNEAFQCEFKKHSKCKKDYSQNPRT